jgi:hypothetical protein
MIKGNEKRKPKTLFEYFFVNGGGKNVSKAMHVMGLFVNVK